MYMVFNALGKATVKIALYTKIGTKIDLNQKMLCPYIIQNICIMLGISFRSIERCICHFGMGLNDNLSHILHQKDL